MGSERCAIQKVGIPAVPLGPALPSLHMLFVSILCTPDLPSWTPESFSSSLIPFLMPTSTLNSDFYTFKHRLCLFAAICFRFVNCEREYANLVSLFNEHVLPINKWHSVCVVKGRTRNQSKRYKTNRKLFLCYLKPTSQINSCIFFKIVTDMCAINTC